MQHRNVPRHGRRDRVLVADVERHGLRARPELTGQRPHALARRVSEDDLGAFGVQGARHGLADPRARTCDQGAATLEAIRGHQVRYCTLSRAPESAERTTASHTSAAR